MKLLQWGIAGIVIAAMFTTGFECASSELTSAKLYLQRKDYQNAEKQLQKEVDKNPKSEEGYYLLGQVRVELKDYRGMKDAFGKALAIAPTHEKEIQSTILSVWGRLFNQAVDEINRATDSSAYLDKAIESFSMAVEVLPESLLTQRNLGLAYFRKGDIPNAAEHLTTAFEKAKDLLAAKLLGRIYLDRGAELKAKFTEENRERIEEMKNLSTIQEKTKAADVRFFLSDSLIQISKPPKPKKGDTKETWRIEKYHLTLGVENGDVTSVKYDNDKPYTPQIDSSKYFQAVAECDKAVDVMKKAQSIFPEEAEISENLMNAYIGAARNTEARLLLNERVKKYPDSKYDHYNLGVFLLKDSSFSAAIDEFKIVLNLDSSFSAAVYNIAAAYVNWGVVEQLKLKAAGKEDDVSYKEKYKLALPYLVKVVSEKKDDIQMLELLGQVYANLNMKDKALEAYDKADAIRKGKN